MSRRISPDPSLTVRTRLHPMIRCHPSSDGIPTESNFTTMTTEYPGVSNDDSYLVLDLSMKNCRNAGSRDSNGTRKRSSSDDSDETGSETGSGPVRRKFRMSGESGSGFEEFVDGEEVHRGGCFSLPLSLAQIHTHISTGTHSCSLPHTIDRISTHKN